MKTSNLYKTYRECPEHMHPHATQGMSFRTLKSIKLAIALLASAHKCSMTKVILAALAAYLQKHEAEINRAAQKHFGRPMSVL